MLWTNNEYMSEMVRIIIGHCDEPGVSELKRLLVDKFGLLESEDIFTTHIDYLLDNLDRPYEFDLLILTPEVDIVSIRERLPYDIHILQPKKRKALTIRRQHG